jgi:hypothetical protein
MRRKKYERRPKRQKTYEEVCRLEPNDLLFNEETGIVIRMEPDRLWPLGELLQKFYSINEGLKPIAFKLVEDDAQSIKEKIWYAVMYAGWHIRIEQGSETGGPHQCQLWYKSMSMRKNFWVATVQLMAFYFNEDEMCVALLLAIDNKEFFMTDEDRDKCITI